MNIAINAMSIRSKYTGIGIYARNLISAISHLDHHNRYFLCLNPENYAEFAVEQVNFRNILVRAPLKKYYLWEQIYLPILLRRNSIDIVHGLRSVIPLLSGARSIVTIHDLAFILFPQVIRYNPINYWPLFVRLSAMRADRIIAVSTNTKNDIVRLYDLPESKISVTYEACARHFKRVVDESVLRYISEKYGLPSRFLLYVGNIEPRKNLDILLKALFILRNEQSLDLKLVLVGKKGWLYSSFFQTVERLGLEKNLVFTGYAEEEDLAGIYTQALAFVFPSKYEGFGLPLLEAMACGTPVIATNASSVPEVVGSSAVLFSPDRPEELAAAIRRVVCDRNLRSVLVDRGIERTRIFSWKKMAAQTLQIYEKLGNESRFCRSC